MPIKRLISEIIHGYKYTLGISSLLQEWYSMRSPKTHLKDIQKLLHESFEMH